MTQDNTMADPGAASPTEMKMQPTEFAALRAQAAAISLGDFHLGRFLSDLLGHVGHAFGLDAASEDARLAAEARADTRKDEDADVKVAADALAASRTAEDSQTRTADQQTALMAARTAEDAKLKADADALAKKREEEDAATLAAQSATPAPVEPVAPPAEPVQPASDAGVTPVEGA